MINNLLYLLIRFEVWTESKYIKINNPNYLCLILKFNNNFSINEISKDPTIQEDQEFSDAISKPWLCL